VSRLVENARRPGRGVRCLAVVAAIVFGLAACEDQQGGGQSAGGSAPPPPSVTVSPALSKTVTDYDTFVGQFAAVESVEVRSRVGGYLQKIAFQDGDVVKKGDPLFVIDQRPFDLAVQAAEAELNQAKATLQLASRELKRAEPLVKRGAISESVFDQRRQEELSAQARVQASQAALDEAKLNLEFSSITAPINGRTGEHLVSIGNLVSGDGSSATMLTTITSTDPIYFYFEVSESDYLRYVKLIQKGQRVDARSSNPIVKIALFDQEGFTRDGVMDYVDSGLDPNTGTIQARVLVPNSTGELLPGLFGQVQLDASGPYEAMLVPDSAVGADQTGRFVYVLGDNNTATYRAVELGPINDGLRVIRSGLAKGDKVIINGISRIRPGATVTPQDGEITPKSAEDAQADGSKKSGG